MKAIFTLIATFLFVSSYSQQFEVKKVNNRLYIYDSTKSYGSVWIKKNWRDYSHFEASANVGYSINSNSRNSDEWIRGGDGRAINLSVGFYTSERFSVGVDYSNIEWRDKVKGGYSAYADPAHIFSLRLQKHILFKHSEIPIIAKVGYTTIQKGEMYGYNRSFSGSGRNFGIGIGYRQNISKWFFVGISVNAGSTVIHGEVTSNYWTSRYVYSNRVDVHYHYALFEAGLRF